MKRIRLQSGCRICIELLLLPLTYTTTSNHPPRTPYTRRIRLSSGQRTQWLNVPTPPISKFPIYEHEELQTGFVLRWRWLGWPPTNRLSGTSRSNIHTNANSNNGLGTAVFVHAATLMLCTSVRVIAVIIHVENSSFSCFAHLFLPFLCLSLSLSL